MICKIAKAELRNLFYSPVAWFLAVVFLIQCAIFYSNVLLPYGKLQELYLNNDPKWKEFSGSLTVTTFLTGNSVFVNVLQNLYLFIPLLTMGLISREINNGTIKLLYSSPVKVRQIVLGKFLAVMIYNLVLAAILAFFMVSAIFSIRDADVGILSSALFGIYLLLCAFTSIGLFMSSLTTYQIISALSSFLMVFILSRIGTLWQKYDFVRDLTYFLSISGRTAKMLRGLIVSKDVIYFLAIMYIFVGFTLVKMKSSRESKPWYIKVSRYIAIFASALAIGYIFSLPKLTLYWDTTATKFNTLHPRIQNVVKEMGDDKLEVTLYTNLLGRGMNQGLPEKRNNYLQTVWEPYIRFKPDIAFKYEYYYDLMPDDSSLYKRFKGKNKQQIAGLMADAQDLDLKMFKSSAEMRKTIDLVPENLRLVMQLKYKGRTTFLRTFDDPMFWPDHPQIGAAFKRLLKAKLPHVYYITGNLERNIYKTGEREFSLHAKEKSYRGSLTNLGFETDSINLNTQDIPDDCVTLVLADPKTELSDTTVKKIGQYIASGRNMLILGHPGKQALLNPLLKTLGVQIREGTILQPSNMEMPTMVTPYITDTAANLADYFRLIQLKEARMNKDYDDSLKILMPAPVSLVYDSAGPFAIKPLLKTVASKTWLKQGSFVTDSADIIFDEKIGDVKGAFTTAVQLTRPVNNKQQRIIVVGNTEFMSNTRGGGDYLATAFYSWLDDNEYPIYTPGKKRTDTRVKFSPGAAKIMDVLYVRVLPAILVAIGAILLVRRNRQ